MCTNLCTEFESEIPVSPGQGGHAVQTVPCMHTDKGSMHLDSIIIWYMYGTSKFVQANLCIGIKLMGHTHCYSLTACMYNYVYMYTLR